MKKLICLLVLVMMASGCVTPPKPKPQKVYISPLTGEVCSVLKYYAHKREKERIDYVNRLTLGMTKEEVIASWGKPNKINRTVTQYGTHEQWVYHHIGDGCYLYFEDGRLTSWQD